MKFELLSKLISTLRSTKLNVKFKNPLKLLVGLKSRSTLKIFTTSSTKAQKKLHWSKNKLLQLAKTIQHIIKKANTNFTWL